MKILDEISKLFFLELSSSEDGLMNKHLEKHYPLLFAEIEDGDLTINSEGMRYSDHFFEVCEKYYPEALV